MEIQNKVIYDWVTFVTRIHSPELILSYLGLDGIQFEQKPGRYCYHDRLSYDGINVYFNGTDEMGVCVEMSGQGCRVFETHGTGDYDGLFELINSNWSDDNVLRDMNITRLDVAYDDFIGVLDLRYFMFAAQRGEYTSRLKDIEVRYSNKGCDVCHGHRHQSNVYVRMYDKKAEKHRDDLDHWVRCEIKLKDVCAHGFIKSPADLRKKYFDVLNNYLRYVIPSENSTNKSMLPSSPEWLNFIESWETLSVFDRPGTEYNLKRLEGYIHSQLSGAISTYINIVGMQNFAVNIQSACEERSGSLNPKYQQLIKEHGTSSTDSILDFLASRGAL